MRMHALASTALFGCFMASQAVNAAPIVTLTLAGSGSQAAIAVANASTDGESISSFSLSFGFDDPGLTFGTPSGAGGSATASGDFFLSSLIEYSFSSFAPGADFSFDVTVLIGGNPVDDALASLLGAVDFTVITSVGTLAADNVDVASLTLDSGDDGDYGGVPLPGSLAFMAVGLGAAAAQARRRKRHDRF